MKKIIPQNKVLDIPLKDLEIGLAQTRTVSTGKEITELAESIGKIGLLQPITVCSARTKGKFEIVAGQRRFLAHQELKAKTIKAIVISGKIDELEAKVISLTENMMRLDPVQKDLIDVCTYLYKKYGTAKAVAESTGLPYYKVNQLVKYEKLTPELKKMLDTNKVDLQTALRAHDAASVSGKTDAKAAVKYAKEMAHLSNEQRKRIVEERRKDPEANADEIIERSKSGADITQLKVLIGPESNKGLQKYAQQEELEPEEAASNLIDSQLKKLGLL